MKKYQIILKYIGGIIILSLYGCTDQDNTLRIYRYINESGVEVAMVGEAYGDIPDSLVIQNGMTYKCSLQYSGLTEKYIDNLYPYNFGDPDNESEFIPLKVYYNKNTCMIYTYKHKGKNPVRINSKSYVIDRNESKNLTTIIYTYTFTPEDYQNAINAQK